MAKLVKARKGVEKFEDSKSLVDTRGYVPIHKRIGALLDAGHRLVAARAELFDLHGDALDVVDPRVVALRQPGVDIADLSEAYREQAKRVNEIRARVRANRLKAAEKRAQQQSGVSNGKSTTSGGASVDGAMPLAGVGGSAPS